MKLKHSFLICLSLALPVLMSACGARNESGGFLEQVEADVAKGDFAKAEIELKNAPTNSVSGGPAIIRLAKAHLALSQFDLAEAQIRRANEQGADMRLSAPVLLEALVHQGDLKKLQAEAEKIAAMQGLEPAVQSLALTYAGRAQGALGQNEDARKSLQRAGQLQPDSAPVKAALIVQQLENGGDPQAGKTAFAALVEKAPDAFEVQVLKAYFMRIEGKNADARAALEKALTIKPYDIDQRLSLARIMIDTGDYVAADQQIQILFKRAPKRPVVLYMAALSAFRQGKLDLARDNSQRVTEAMPNFMPGFELASEVALQAGDLALAETLAKTLVTRNPNLLSGYRLLALVYLADKSPEKALAVLDPLIKSRLASPELLALAGTAATMTGDRSKGTQYFDAAVAASGSSPDAARLKLLAANVRMGSGADSAGLALLDAAASGAGTASQLAIARSYANAREFDKSKQLIATYIKAVPNDPEGPFTLAMVAMAQGQSAEARKAFEDAVKVNPAYLPAADALAQLDLAGGKKAEALARYDQALKANPKLVGAYLSRARISASSGGTEEEIQGYFKQAREVAPTSTQVIASEALYLASRGRFAAAIALLEPAHQNNPGDRGLTQLLVRTYGANAQYGKAVEILEKDIERNPSSTELNMEAGRMRLALADPGGAMKLFARALELSPQALEPKLAIAELQYKTGRRTEALLAAKAIVDAFPGNAAGPTLLGNLLEAEGRLPDALAQFRRAFELSKTSPALVNLYRGLLLNKNKDEARRVLEQWWAKSQSKDLGAMVAASEILIGQEDWQAAVAVLNEVLKVAPKSVPALNNAAIAVHHLGEPKALQLARNAAQLEPDNFAVLDTLGWILVEQGNTEEGMRHLKAALEKAPNSPDVHIHLAMAYQKLGDKTQARSEALAALKGNPPAPIRTQAQELLK